jgi:hypothetical protein
VPCSCSTRATWVHADSRDHRARAPMWSTGPSADPSGFVEALLECGPEFTGVKWLNNTAMRDESERSSKFGA